MGVQSLLCFNFMAVFWRGPPPNDPPGGSFGGYLGTAGGRRLSRVFLVSLTLPYKYGDSGVFQWRPDSWFSEFLISVGFRGGPEAGGLGGVAWLIRASPRFGGFNAFVGFCCFCVFFMGGPEKGI